jgi:hypothetical protein
VSQEEITMPEGSIDATILLATSWQALKRAKSGDERTMICNCTVVVVFAAFFIEANLNHIVDKMDKNDEMFQFLGNPNAGLQHKLAWFYNRFVARPKAVNKRQMYSNGIERKLRRRFPGFYEIYNFRNNISHGIINRGTANINDAKRLRIRAKEIVDELFRISAKVGYDVPRSVTYEVAIKS